VKGLVITLAVVVTLILGVISWSVLGTDQIDGNSIRWFIALSIAAGLAYLAFLWVASRSRYTIESSTSLWMTLLILAFAARIVVAVGAGEQAWLSDDIYRYVWEGKLVSHEMNPFTVSPEQLENSGLADDSIFPNIDHPWLPTIYPPLSQYLFALAYRLGGDSLFGFKFLAFLFELLTAIMMIRFAREMHLPRWSVLVYLFCPLVFIEFIISSHVDILAIPFLLMFLLSSSLRKPKPIAAGLWLAAAAMIKLPALLFALPLLFGYDWNLVKSPDNVNFLSGRVNALGWQSWGLFRYDASKRRWTMVGGDPYDVIESARAKDESWLKKLHHNMRGAYPKSPTKARPFAWSWQPPFYNFCRDQWGFQFDLTGRMHVRLNMGGLDAYGRSRQENLYVWSDDKGKTLHLADGTPVKLPITINPAPGHNAERDHPSNVPWLSLWCNLLRKAGYSVHYFEDIW